jgi:hypothetical protein
MSVEETRNTYRILVKKPLRKHEFGLHRIRWVAKSSDLEKGGGLRLIADSYISGVEPSVSVARESVNLDLKEILAGYEMLHTCLQSRR